MLGERLRAIREDRAARQGRKIYQRDVARLLQISEHQYRAYEYGRAQLPERHAKTLAAEWERPWQDFYRVAGRRRSDVGEPTLPIGSLDVPIPYVGRISASSRSAWSNPLDADIEEFVPEEMAARGRFACRIDGDSCYPWLWPDDLCVWQATETERIGRIIIHRTPDNLVTVKQLKHDGERFILHPGNPSYEDVPATGRQVGFLIGILRDVGDLRLTIYKKGEAILPADLLQFGPNP